MFEKIQERYYESFIKSFNERKKLLNLTREQMLKDPKRITNIRKLIYDEHHPHLIGKSEYAYLNYLFLCNDHNSFEKENILNHKPKDHIAKNGNNYDKMLWGHIDWDKMFQDVITELSELKITNWDKMFQNIDKDLSELNISEKFRKLFENTLVDYAPYANIRYDELDKKYPRIFNSPDKIKEIRQDAIEWVHLRHGSELFKQTFYEKFSGKTLCEFDTEFHEFVEDYLKKRRPNNYSFGLQVYKFHKHLSRFVLYWQSLDSVRYGDTSDEELNIETLLKECIENSREQMKKLEEYQQKFDALHINIK